MKSISFSLLFLFHTIVCYGQHSNTMNEDTLTWKATVVKVPFMNKRGKVMEDMGELYLQKEGERYFIKFRGGQVLRKEVEQYLDKEITVKLSLRKGNWDTDDSNDYQQSRVGEYVLLYKILE